MIMFNNMIHVSMHIDSVARCAMLNMKQYNEHFGCTFCEHPTSDVEGLRKYPISTNIPEDRTDASIKRDMILAYKTGKKQNINGVWGPSPLMNLQYYDLAEGMVADYMHSILLGVIRQYTEIILTSVNEDFYVGSPDKLAIINSRLLKISPPSSISRSPRNLTERKIWKASEWRSWLILYSLVCLHGVLPQKYLQHLALFVVAINILLQSSITLDMLHHAERLLIKFVILFQMYFKKRAMSYNVHLILHLCKGVRNWGPLWTHNTFPFENQNRFLLQLMKNPNRIASEVASRMLSFQKLSLFKEKVNSNPTINQIYETISRKKPLLKKIIKINNCLLIGTGKIYTLTFEEIIRLNNPDRCISFDKFIFNGIRYTTATYQSKRCKKDNDSIVQIKSGEIGCISRILQVNRRETSEVVLFIHIIKFENNPFINNNNVRVEHIRKCSEINSNLTVFQKPEDILRQCILIKCYNKHYISVIPKGCLNE